MFLVGIIFLRVELMGLGQGVPGGRWGGMWLERTCFVECGMGAPLPLRLVYKLETILGP